MVAGSSAGAEEQRGLARALEAAGQHVLVVPPSRDRRRVPAHLVVVGPGGVFVVGIETSSDVSIDGDRVRRGQTDVTDELMALADVAYAAEEGFAEVGLAPGEVRPVVVLGGHRGTHGRIGPVRIVGADGGSGGLAHQIASFGRRLTPAQVEVVLAQALTLFPQAGPGQPAAVGAEAEPAGAPVASVPPPGDSSLPLPEWMAVLHPAQARLVRRSFNGPARIRGAAGTGKSVVGLHRAAYLARSRPGTVLMTSLVRTLPVVLRELLGQMAPDVADRVEFVSVPALARNLLATRGVAVRLDPVEVVGSMDRAWAGVGRDGPLPGVGLGREYWEDEITYVLKGRGVTCFEQYANLARTGRRHRLPLELRTAVWDLYRAYDSDLHARGFHDEQDLILLAEAELRRQPLAEPYSAVVVDEAQDLSCAMLRLLHGLAGDGHDGLTLLGDGQQALYPGGYTLAEAGVSLAGRSVVLDINHRTTAQILAFASRLVVGDEFADIEGTPRYGDVSARIARTGPRPRVERCVSWRAREARLVERVHSVVENVGTSLGDVAVLCATTAGVARATAALARAGLPVVDLASYDGRPVAAVKVGTIKHAKGLDFTQVLLADVQANWISDDDVPADGAALERWELRRRELFVAMTRAREGLWLGVV